MEPLATELPRRVGVPRHVRNAASRVRPARVGVCGGYIDAKGQRHQAVRCKKRKTINATLPISNTGESVGQRAHVNRMLECSTVALLLSGTS